MLFPFNRAQIERFIRDNPQRPQRRRNLIFLGVWLVMLVAWYLVGLPIGPGVYPRLN
ncbi:hypothetical protein [Enterobacter hormaechei]|uniref:hypothetical protein n=1 Tax=Enterobacter hormaechei TaxID=158836 RepID=UPI0022873EBB|nr:hypothetical protein [Enterobacter hormaechei]